LLQSAQEVLQDSVDRAGAERHLRQAEAQYNKKEPRNTEELFAEDASGILKSKTKRLKQHSGRSQARAEKGRTLQSLKSHLWPQIMLAAALDFPDWDQDLFMHIAIKVMAGYFELQGLQVETKDGIRVWQLREQVKKIIAECSSSVGVCRYELSESTS